MKHDLLEWLYITLCVAILIAMIFIYGGEQ